MIFKRVGSFVKLPRTADNDLALGDDLRTMGVSAAPKEEGNLLAWGGVSSAPSSLGG